MEESIEVLPTGLEGCLIISEKRTIAIYMRQVGIRKPRLEVDILEAFTNKRGIKFYSKIGCDIYNGNIGLAAIDAYIEWLENDDSFYIENKKGIRRNIR